MDLNLRYAKLYFDTSTFDKITEDQAATPVDKISAIGGTIGLLTGFSLNQWGGNNLFCSENIYQLYEKEYKKNLTKIETIGLS